MGRSIKILTFNWHVPYICLLAGTGHEFFVIEPETPSGRRRWDHEMRPPPANVRVLDDSTWRRGLDDDVFDLVICHNHMDLTDLLGYSVPKILVLHNRLSTSLAMGDGLDKRQKFWENVFLPLYRASDHLRFVAISSAKKADWGLPARVILPGTDLAEFDGYRGDVPRVLRIGNYMKERDLMMGFTSQESIVGDLPTTVLGINPTVAGSRLSENFDDLRDQLRAHRVYLNTTVDPWEDGYNLAMLEAMATGMPVVTTANATSPIVDGVNGYISDDENELHDRLERLLAEPELARKLGAEARRTVAEQFPIERFVENWREVIADTIRAHGECSTIKTLGSARVSRRRILMAYTANPTTTASYLERALRQDHKVVTCGPVISEEVLAGWDMLAVKDLVRPHDIELDTEIDMKTVLDGLPDGFTPDLFIWVESGINVMPPDLHLVECPKAGYFIDSHINLEWHVQWARQFDHVFVAQRAYLDAFRRAGCPSVHWLPLACDPEIHRPSRVAADSDEAGDIEKPYDVGFVGSITPQNPRRRLLLEQLSKDVPVHIERCFLDKMVDVFNQSRIVLNTALRNDLNMRVFEVLGCGAMLLTDEAPGSGLEDLFKHDIHFALYFDDTLPESARRYLDKSGQRERIAAEGRREALAHHTYRHRARHLVRTVFEGTGERSEPNLATIVRQVPQTAARILVAGRPAADIARILKEVGFVHIAGIDTDLAYSTPESTSVFVDVLEGPAADLESAGAPFDVIVLVDMLEHCVRPAETLSALDRLLADDGSMVINIHNARFLRHIESLVEGRWMTADEMRTIGRPMTLADVQTMLAQTGLQPVNVVALAPHGSLGIAVAREQVTFGAISLEGLSETDVQELYTAQFVITAVAAADESLTQAEESYRQGDYGAALSRLDAATVRLALGPRARQSAILRGRCHEALGDWQAAEAAYESAMDETERPAAALLGLARAALARDDTAVAAELIERTDGLELNAADRVDRGCALLRIGNPQRAAVDYRSVLDEDAAHRDAVRGLIEAARMLGDLDPALPYIDSYLGLRAADVETLYDAACIDRETGRTDLAVERLDTVLMLDPDHAEARRYLDQLKK